jgi:hypothetical protein
MGIERVANPMGDRVKITMIGKFLPYKYYDASGNVLELVQGGVSDARPLLTANQRKFCYV